MRIINFLEACKIQNLLPEKTLRIKDVYGGRSF